MVLYLMNAECAAEMDHLVIIQHISGYPKTENKLCIIPKKIFMDFR